MTGRALFCAACLVAGLVAFTRSDAAAQEAVRREARPGQIVILDSAACVRAIEPEQALRVARTGNISYAVYEVPLTATADQSIVIETGSAYAADGVQCVEPQPRRYHVVIDQTPTVPPTSLEQAFRILMAAFVLALLLESAFALLFNWRVFQALFVGRAVRTPIMFAAALLIVRQFDVDLMASLFQAYSGTPTSPAADGKPWLSSILTAMVLAGGSVGVHRILTGLGFRAPARPETEVPALERDEAWVAIEVRSKQGGRPKGEYAVLLDEIASQPEPPTTVGIARPSVGNPVKSLFFPNSWRVPPSGGRTVKANQTYEVGVQDLKSMTFYDLAGNASQTCISTRVRFAPRAIIDLTVTVS